MMPETFQLFYVSETVMRCDDAAVKSILHMARRTNRRLDVTGCLLYSGRHFAQVLEGRESVVRALADKIASDARHRNIRVLLESRRKEREFSDWSMGYLYDLSLEDALESMLCASEIEPRFVRQIVGRMRPDTVVGALD